MKCLIRSLLTLTNGTKAIATRDNHHCRYIKATIAANSATVECK